MLCAALRCSMTWTEDRATQRCDPSADSGAETEARAPSHPDGVRSSLLRDRPESVKPSRQDAATCLAERTSPLANAARPKFQFTVNQDRFEFAAISARKKNPRQPWLTCAGSSYQFSSLWRSLAWFVTDLWLAQESLHNSWRWFRRIGPTDYP